MSRTEKLFRGSNFVQKFGPFLKNGVPAIAIDCGIHSNEWIAPAMCRLLINELIKEFGVQTLIFGKNQRKLYVDL